MAKRNVLMSFSVLTLLLSACSAKQEQKTTETKGSPVMETTSAGLRYKTLKDATDSSSQKPVMGQRVVAHYTGWLDAGEGELGEKFDSSVDRGEPFEFIVGIGQVIRGWDMALQDMKIGEKRRVFIPSELGYGARGAGAVIPPNADLVFDIELIDIK